MTKQWRLVVRRNQIGKPYKLQLGIFRPERWNPEFKRFKTEQQYDFNTREEALAWLKDAPESWGDKSLIL